MSWALFGWLLLLSISTVSQVILAMGFMRRLRQSRCPLLPDADCPPALVVLCLRGEDPYLEECIRGLLKQDYPNYRVHFLLDHSSDPSVGIVERTLGETGFGAAIVDTLRSPPPTCSLKCASLIQACASLPDDVQFVAQLDADTIPHASWLRELATALAPQRIGAVSGNRWYMPRRLSWGALVRYLWNAAAVVQMYWYRIPWGGSLAIKVSAIRDAGLRELWQHAFCEDTMLRKQLAHVGLAVDFVPSLMMVNREDCTIRSFFSWVTRQLLTARLYHPSWLMVLLHGLSGFAILAIGWSWGLIELVRGRLETGCLLLISMFAYQVALAILVPWMESSVARVVSDRGEKSDGNARFPAWMVFCAIAVTQVAYTLALIRTLLLRRVEWRGIPYRISGPWNIHRLNYRPYAEFTREPVSTQISL